MKIDFLDKIEKLDKREMVNIRGGREKPTVEDEIIILRKRTIM